jgi:hypothetical protein
MNVDHSILITNYKYSIRAILLGDVLTYVQGAADR